MFYQNFDRWLVESHLCGCFCLFASKFWECGEDLQMIFCLSVSVVWVGSTLIGGGGHSNLNGYDCICLIVCNFCTRKWYRCLNIDFAPQSPSETFTA